MKTYNCPLCKNQAVAWDARSRHFYCHMQDCVMSCPPPLGITAGGDEVGLAITTGRYEVDQEWIDHNYRLPGEKFAHLRQQQDVSNEVLLRQDFVNNSCYWFLQHITALKIPWDSPLGTEFREQLAQFLVSKGIYRNREAFYPEVRTSNPK